MIGDAVVLIVVHCLQYLTVAANAVVLWYFDQCNY